MTEYLLELSQPDGGTSPGEIVNNCLFGEYCSPNQLLLAVLDALLAAAGGRSLNQIVSAVRVAAGVPHDDASVVTVELVRDAVGRLTDFGIDVRESGGSEPVYWVGPTGG